MKIDQSLILTIDQISNAQKKQPGSSPETDKSQSPSFSKTLMDSIEKVNAMQKEADKAIGELVVGDSKDVVQTMIKMEKADISFRLMMQVRNKILQAYEEVMRTQV